MYRVENNNNNVNGIKIEHSTMLPTNSFSPFVINAMDMNTSQSLAATQLHQQVSNSTAVSSATQNVFDGKCLPSVHSLSVSAASAMSSMPLSIQSSSLPASGSSSSGPSPTSNLPKISPEYLQELLKDKRNLQNFPNVFHHVEKIIDSEISRVRGHLFHINGSAKVHEDLPDPEGTMVTVQEKVYIPIQDNPNYNFVGRILGPRGMTAKQLETDLGCKIMIRGKGSMRDKKKEEQNRGKPNWEHLSEELHVLICVEDYQNRAEIKAKRAADEIKKFLEEAVKMNDSEDKLKQMQLMELALMNEANKTAPMLQHQGLALTAAAPQFLRLPGHAGAAGSPILLAPGNPRLPPVSTAAAMSGGAHHLLSPSDPTAQLFNYPMVSAADYNNYLLAQGLMGDPAAAAAAAAYSAGIEFSHAGPMKARLAATAANLRSHPYSRVPGL